MEEIANEPLFYCLQVEDWLRGLYSSQKKTSNKLPNAEVPSFEKNKTTIDVLEDLLLANQAADQRADEEMRIMKSLQNEYQAESETYNISLIAFFY